MEKQKVRIKGVRGSLSNEIWVDGIQIQPKHSQAIRNHSPDGFNWGYGGSGAAQAALGICLAVFNNQYLAAELYMDFKWSVVATWPVDGDFETVVDFAEFLLKHPDAVQRARENQQFSESLPDYEN